MSKNSREYTLGEEAALRAELRQRLADAIDCGQEDVCKVPPGCQRHWEERCLELNDQLQSLKLQKLEVAESYKAARRVADRLRELRSKAMSAPMGRHETLSDEFVWLELFAEIVRNLGPMVDEFGMKDVSFSLMMAAISAVEVAGDDPDVVFNDAHLMWSLKTPGEMESRFRTAERVADELLAKSEELPEDCKHGKLSE